MFVTIWFLIEFQNFASQKVIGKKLSAKKPTRPTNIFRNNNKISGSKIPLDLKLKPSKCTMKFSNDILLLGIRPKKFSCGNTTFSWRGISTRQY